MNLTSICYLEETLNICIATLAVVLAIKRSDPPTTAFEFVGSFESKSKTAVEIKIFAYQPWLCH